MLLETLADTETYDHCPPAWKLRRTGSAEDWRNAWVDFVRDRPSKGSCRTILLSCDAVRQALAVGDAERAAVEMGRVAASCVGMEADYDDEVQELRLREFEIGAAGLMFVILADLFPEYDDSDQLPWVDCTGRAEDWRLPFLELARDRPATASLGGAMLLSCDGVRQALAVRDTARAAVEMARAVVAREAMTMATRFKLSTFRRNQRRKARLPRTTWADEHIRRAIGRAGDGAKPRVVWCALFSVLGAAGLDPHLSGNKRGQQRIGATDESGVQRKLTYGTFRNRLSGYELPQAAAKK